MEPWLNESSLYDIGRIALYPRQIPRNNAMYTKSLLLSVCAVLLVGCTGRGFQPPAPDYTKWYKEGVSQTGSIAAMRACGYTNVDGAGDRSPIDVRLLNFYCHERRRLQTQR
ncbi:MAG: hypothetical protein ACFWUJ_17935 [Pseudomonas fragi]|jgi:hypothetical protein